MKSFSERNLVAIAVSGLLVLTVGVLAVFESSNLPIIGAGPTYSADFSESAGLQSGDDVLVAGVKIGTVSDVSLQGSHVKVDFRVKSAWLGNDSTAAIRIQTLLGEKYLAIDPEGGAKLKTSSTIPLSRTTSPYDVTQALSGLSNTLTAINTTQLADSFNALSSAFANTPPEVRGTLQGLSALSQTIASRDQQISALLAGTQTVTATLADNDQQVQALFHDGNLLLQLLNQRSTEITALLQGTVSLSSQLTGLVHDDEATLQPALLSLGHVTTVLQQNQVDLQRGLALIGPYYRLLTDATGNGRWLDTYVCGLFTPQGTPQLNSTVVRTCDPSASTSGGL
jgi:phospholipid/cholesterol/gamma-HCH transport system substrate-binding protein